MVGPMRIIEPSTTSCGHRVGGSSCSMCMPFEALRFLILQLCSAKTLTMTLPVVQGEPAVPGYPDLYLYKMGLGHTDNVRRHLSSDGGMSSPLATLSVMI